ncbi:MAG: DNA translocase FtsK [Oscillospiraceae bacterium]|nr:DNA translocase FtsK [Oscillospiraceae bacterium]
MAFSIYGAYPVLIVLLLLCCICAFNGSFKKAADKVKIQVQAQYDPSLYENSLSPVLPNLGAVKAPRKIERMERGSYSPDIPLGEEPDDALSLMQSISDSSVLPQQETKPRRKTKVNVIKETATEGVMTLSAEDAALIAGIDLQAFDEPKAAKKEKTTVRPTAKSSRGVAVAEISDPPKIQKLSREEVNAEAQAVAEAINATEEKPDYVFPPLSLLHSGTTGAGDAREEILLNKERLEGAIRSFGIGAKIVGVTRGPTVTRYDIELEQGVKLSRVTNLAGDLALALGVVNVRIAPIPEKISTVGIEVPNKIVSTVCLRDIIDTPKFANAKSKLSFALGKDISGECIIGNIAKLPHMLIAGTTGSGKSVCMNSLILSLLYKARPDEVKLIMIDPKMVELGVYNGIPHLYVPVVTDPKKAAGALQWSVVEMLKRYRLFSEVGVRDLENYNRHCVAAGEPTLPQVVIVIDELADLMMIASKDVEESICRVAQMGRAAGMHLIIATQRPSADVITGLMKANIPSRIAFAVSSTLESRIILDQGGAEKLIGMGDMLFSPVGIGKPIRIQGAFVSDEEREEVIQFIKEGSGETQQNSEIEEFMNKAAEEKNNADSGASAKEEKSVGGYDEMLPQAVEVVLETKSCSVSMLQRRIKLGYSRAARIVDQMEELGVVGPYEGAKPRSVVVDREGWNEIARSLGLIDGDDMAIAAQMSEDSDSLDYDN